MAAFQLFTLGPLRLVDSAGADQLRGRRKELALLAFVARRAPRDVPREELTALLWGDRDTDRARHSLRQTLLRLKQTLGSAIDVDSARVRLRADAIALDVHAFEADVSAAHYASAIAVWRGDFLQDADDSGGEAFSIWLEQEREALRQRLAFALAKLLDDAEARHAWDEASALAERFIEVRPLDESAHARLIRVLRASGRVADALARHAAAKSVLQDEATGGATAEFARLGEDLERAVRGRRLAPGSTALLTPDLIGRDGVLGELDAEWRRLEQRGSVVLIEGEAGIGKTRVVAEFGRRLRADASATLVLECRGAEPDDDAPLAAARRVLAPLARAARLGDASNRSLGALTTLVPSLRDRFPHLGPPATDDHLLADAVRDVLRLVAERAPVALIVDDVTAVDARTAALLVALIRRPAPGTLTLLAGRSDELAQSSIADEVRRVPGARWIRLKPLSVDEVDRVVASMLELAPADRSTLATRLHDESGGNPFYLTELVSALADTGLLSLGNDGTWRLAGDVVGRSLPLPRGVRGAIRQRLDRLDEDARVVFDACALAGFVQPSVLASATQLPDSRFASAIETLIARRLVRASTDAPARYEPSHELLRRVTCELVPPARRDVLLAGIAAAAEAERWPIDTVTPLASTRAEPPVQRRSRLWSRRTAVAVVASIVAIGGAGAAWRTARSSPPATRYDRVLVAPFANETSDSTLNPLSGIVADWLAQGIARTGLVKVVPLAVAGDHMGGSDRSASRAVLGRSAGSARSRARSMAIDARAEIVVWGSIVRSGDSLRLQASITDARTGELLQSTPAVTGHVSGPLVVVEALRRRTLAALAPLVDERMAAWARVASAPPSYEAYLAFAEGLDAFSRGDPDRGALDPFLRAYTLDTSFTLPLLYAAWGVSGAGQHIAADSILRVLRPRREALAPFDRALLDYLVASHDRDRTATYAAALAVAEIAPESYIAAVQLPYTAMAINRPYRAREILERVVPGRGQVRDNSGYWDAYAHALHMTGDYNRQLEVARELRRRVPSERAALSYETRALAALGRVSEMYRVLEESIAIPANPLWGAPGLRYYIVASDELRAHGYPAAADSVLARAIRVYSAVPDELRSIPKQRFEMARALYRLGRLEEAKRLLEPLVATNALAPLGDYIIEARAHLGFIAARTGDTTTARATDRWLRDLRGPQLLGQNTELRAALHALLGEREEAVRLLHQAVAEGRFFDVGKHVYFEYQGLRGYPPFDAWLAPKG